jgi:hypothetical protein
MTREAEMKAGRQVKTVNRPTDTGPILGNTNTNIYN